MRACIVLVHSESRSAQFATAAALAFGLSALARQRRAQIAAYFVAGAVVVVGLVRFSGDLLELSGKDETLTGRSEIWRLVSGWIGDRPAIGYGPGNVWLVTDEATALFDFYQVPDNAHNGFLEAMLGGGILVLVPLVLLLVRAFGRAVDRGPDGDLRYHGLLPVLILILVANGSLVLLFRNSLVPVVFAALTVPPILLLPSGSPADRDTGVGRGG